MDIKLTFPKRQILDTSKMKESAEDTLNLRKMVESSLEGGKTLWEKEKLLVRSYFSFSQCVFK